MLERDLFGKPVPTSPDHALLERDLFGKPVPTFPDHALLERDLFGKPVPTFPDHALFERDLFGKPGPTFPDHAPKKQRPGKNPGLRLLARDQQKWIPVLRQIARQYQDFAHDLIGEPVSTSPDHALGTRWGLNVIPQEMTTLNGARSSSVTVHRSLGGRPKKPPPTMATMPSRRDSDVTGAAPAVR